MKLKFEIQARFLFTKVKYGEQNKLSIEEKLLILYWLERENPNIDDFLEKIENMDLESIELIASTPLIEKEALKKAFLFLKKWLISESFSEISNFNSVEKIMMRDAFMSGFETLDTEDIEKSFEKYYLYHLIGKDDEE